MSKIITKIITFLGVNLKRDRDNTLAVTEYRHNGQDYKGFVFAQALYQFCEFDQMLVCMTDKARKDAWEVLLASGEATELENERVRAVSIETGWNTAEMWKIFETIVQHVDEGDKVIFDITHSLRSLPFLVFLFAAYLKKAKNVSIQAIYYGALDLSKDNGGVAPVIDLSSFVGMLDWLTATELFTKTGDGKALAELIQTTGKAQIDQLPDGKETGGHLEDAANAINDISLALALTRPREVRTASEALNNVMAEAAESLEKVKPFALVKEQVQFAYGQFEVAGPEDVKASLLKEFAMIEWYLGRQQIAQAITLAVEWIMSVYCWRLRQTNRDKIRQALNNLPHRDLQAIIDFKVGKNYSADDKSNMERVKTIKKDYKKYDEPLRREEDISQIQDVWNRTKAIRNQIAHCGMSGNESASSIQEAANNLKEDLKKIVELLR
jgi:CRISPR-associated DxTHG motif protein